MHLAIIYTMKIIAFQDFLRRFYSGEEFIVFDTETTGLNTFHDDIIEIGAQKWSKAGKMETFCELMWVNPNKISPESWQIHKIPLEEIENAKKPTEVFDAFKAFCGNRAMVAHNIKFDFPMLNSNLIKNGLTPYQNDDVACTLMFAKEKALPGRLHELATHFKITTQSTNLHRALYDVSVLIEVLDVLMKLHEPEEIQYSLLI